MTDGSFDRTMPTRPHERLGREQVDAGPGVNDHSGAPRRARLPRAVVAHGISPLNRIRWRSAPLCPAIPDSENLDASAVDSIDDRKWGSRHLQFAHSSDIGGASEFGIAGEHAFAGSEMRPSPGRTLRENASSNSFASTRGRRARSADRRFSSGMRFNRKCQALVGEVRFRLPGIDPAIQSLAGNELALFRVDQRGFNLRALGRPRGKEGFDSLVGE